MLYYWTNQPEEPAVYHNNSQCPRGLQILPQHRESSYTRPYNRHLCKDC